MTHTVLYGYVIGWAVTSIGLMLGSPRLAGRAGIAVMGGAVWPLLAIGAAQFGAVALITEVARNAEPNPTSDEEFEGLLAEWATDASLSGGHRFVTTTSGDNGGESGTGR
jgi:hypothetical protein